MTVLDGSIELSAATRLWIERVERKYKDKPDRQFNFDTFPTIPEIAHAAINRWELPPGSRSGDLYVLDPGAGDGVWGAAVRSRFPTAYIVGYDIRDIPRPEEYDEWHNKTDFLTVKELGNFDLVVGNPPFAIAEQFVGHSIAATTCYRPGGFSWKGEILFMLRAAFMAGFDRYEELWKPGPQCRAEVLIPRPSFTGNGISDPKTEYAVFNWQCWKERDVNTEPIVPTGFLKWRENKSRKRTTKKQLRLGLTS